MLILMIAVSCYSMIQLGKLSEAARVALKVEQRIIYYSERLADAFLSEARYAGKFNVTHASQHYDQYLQFRSDYERNISELKPLASSIGTAQRLARVEKYHAQYRQLFAKEVDYIKTKQPYAESRYREEKERLIDYLLRELDALKDDVQKSLQDRIEYIERAATKSQKITLAATLALVAIGFITYYLSGRIPQEVNSAHGPGQTTIGRLLRFHFGKKGQGAAK